MEQNNREAARPAYYTGRVSLPQVKDLDEIMEAFVAPYELDLTQNVELCQKILARRLMEIEVTEP